MVASTDVMFAALFNALHINLLVSSTSLVILTGKEFGGFIRQKVWSLCKT